MRKQKELKLLFHLINILLFFIFIQKMYTHIQGRSHTMAWGGLGPPKPKRSPKKKKKSKKKEKKYNFYPYSLKNL